MSQHNQVPRFFVPPQGNEVAKVLFNGNSNYCTFAYGLVVPTDATAGFMPGCIFQHIDGGDGTSIYVNEGTSSSCDFNPVIVQSAGSALTTQLTTLTIADAAGTPDYSLQAVINSSAWGFASQQEAISTLYVIRNLQVRLAEVEARLQAAGIVA